MEEEYDEAAPVRKRGKVRSLLAGSMAQLMVLMTGLVLAVTAYAVLNMLIQQMVRDDAERTFKSAQRAISERIVNLEHTINTTAMLAGLSHDSDLDTIVSRVHAAVADTVFFDYVFWVRRAPGQSDYKIVDILARDTSGIPKASQTSLINSLLLREQEGISQVIVMPDPPGSRFWQEYSEPLVKGQPFVLARTVTKGSQSLGMIVGVVRISRAIDLGWLANRPSIKQISLKDTENDSNIYYMNRDYAAGRALEPAAGKVDMEFPLGDRVWRLSLIAGQDERISLLENMPWLMLLFGVTLTMVGTLYVRNNQRQSFKLTLMNRELAQKNYELNSEISERERLNQVLRKAEREYKAIIDAVSDIIFETSVKGDIIFLNDTWTKVTGFDIEQALGRNLFELLHPQEQEGQRTSFDLLVKGKKSAYRTFTRLRSSDGTFRTVELAMSMLRHDENRNMRVVGTLTDIEERRRAEKALSEAEKKYRTIVENAAGGIYQVTPEGQFLSANPAMARILGYDTAEQMLREVRNAHDNLYVRVRDRAIFISDLGTVGFVHNFETEVRTRDGVRIWVNENARAVKDDDGNILYYEGSMEDITSRKQAELKLREAKVQSDLANRAKSEFLANMSHELRTPLNAIIGFAEIIKNEVLGPLENRQYWEYASDIHASGRRLLTIINEILDVSRIEAGDRQINEGVVDMNKVIGSCIDFTRQKQLSSERLTIVNMSEGKVPSIIGEELAIKQILINLLSNAIKYTPGEGRITVSHEVENDGRLRLSITDTGIGMEDYEITKALSPFGQLETSLSRADSGAGLGLTLVESLMKLHDGKIELFSQKGIGTTATLVFPARRVALENAGQDAGQIVDNRRERFDRRQKEDRRSGAERRDENPAEKESKISGDGDGEQDSGAASHQIH